ncbi:MAG: hypothetical protein WCG45_02960 [bacterium]
MDLFFINIAYASETMDEFIGKVDKLIINPLIILLFALALAFFLYGVLEFIFNQENEEKKTSGKSHMIWGIVGIVVMMSVFSLLQIIMNTFGIEGIDPEQGTVILPSSN